MFLKSCHDDIKKLLWAFSSKHEWKSINGFVTAPACHKVQAWCERCMRWEVFFEISHLVLSSRCYIVPTLFTTGNLGRRESFSHPQQGRIDFITVNPSLPTGMDFLIHPCRWIDDEENVRTPPILERNWKIHPLRPQDFPWPSFWWSTDTLLMITLIWEKYTWNVRRS